MRNAAKVLRKYATRSERLLWEALKNRRLAGKKFRRQHPVSQFVVDFCCLEEMLAIEVDGSVHDGRDGVDLERQRILEAMGFRFLRVSAEDVERDLPSVISQIEVSLVASTCRAPESTGASNIPPSPAPGRGAGGEGSCP